MQTENSRHTSAPDESLVYVRAAVVDKCNLACRYCPKASGMENIVPRELAGTPVSLKTYFRNLTFLNDRGINAISYTGGEPTLSRSLPEFLDFARSVFRRVELTTNGVRLKACLDSISRNVDVVKVSLDAMDSEVVQFATRSTRPHELKIATDAIQMLAGEGVSVGINVVVGKYNRNQLQNVLEYCDKLVAVHGANIYVSLLDMYYNPEIDGFYRENYIPVADAIAHLDLRSGVATDRRGCSMTWFRYGDVNVRVKDSGDYTYRAPLCETCKTPCQEGMYAVRHSVEGWITCCPYPISENGVFASDTADWTSTRDGIDGVLGQLRSTSMQRNPVPFRRSN